MSDTKDIIDLITTPTPVSPKPAETNIPAETVIVATDADLLGSPSQPVPPAAADQTQTAPTPADQSQPAATDKKPPGRPPGAKNKPKAPKADFSDIAAATAVESVVDYKLMSGALFDLSTGVLTTAFGPEWQPRPPQKVGEILVDERGAVCAALETYLKSKQAKDIPPGLMLAFVAVAYAAPRLQAPTTKEKIMPAITWAWLKIKTFFSRRKTADYQIIPAATKQ